MFPSPPRDKAIPPDTPHSKKGKCCLIYSVNLKILATIKVHRDELNVLHEICERVVTMTWR